MQPSPTSDHSYAPTLAAPVPTHLLDTHGLEDGHKRCISPVQLCPQYIWVVAGDALHLGVQALAHLQCRTAGANAGEALAHFCTPAVQNSEANAGVLDTPWDLALWTAQA